VGTVVGRTPEGDRLLATVPAEDEAMIAFLTDGKMEPVGSAGQVRRLADGMLQWSAL
jgi:acetyl-CoA C-acetyltransferase